jgi:hypothetical protein
LTTHSNLPLWFRLGRAIHLLPFRASMSCYRETIYLALFTLVIRNSECLKRGRAVDPVCTGLTEHNSVHGTRSAHRLGRQLHWFFGRFYTKYLFTNQCCTSIYGRQGTDRLPAETGIFSGHCTSWFFSFSFFSVALRPNAVHGLLILEVSRSHTTTHHSR